MKNSHKIFFAAILALTMGACTKDFEEVNTNPNAPISVTPGLLLPAVQRDMVNALMNESWGIGNIVIQQTAKNQFVNEDRYLWGELNGIWNTVYGKLRDVENIRDAAVAGNQKNYEAIALILRSWMFSLATDAYGDIPYSEAINGKDGVYYPKYDTQESIYNGILNDLKTASDLLGTTSETVSGDLIYKGDLAKWKKLANSLRIRALMRISNKRNVSADLASIVDNPTQYPIFTGNGDHGVYVYRASSPDQFPLYSARIGSFNEFRASKTLVDYLNATSDPRIQTFFRPTPASLGTDTAVIRGIPNGLDDVASQTYLGGQQNHSQIGVLYYESAISGDGLNVAKGIIMTYAELQFCLAEAAQKGLIAGDPATYYTQGVNASYSFYGLTPAADFFTNPLVAYSGTDEEKLEKIGYQKWVSLYFQGLEAWFDWRRTGFPRLQPAVSNQNNGLIPVRFIYPIIEQALNGSNRQAAVDRQGADNINTKMWHLK
ncbi:MAG: SusD/RagB family nutrient-binding outer membrane lipoprotein [Saprospiraceae bacterium]|nr:SusD/RagB family nutrient-binding outer membrane lipoprotein [Saprospiraceae bacterium]